MEEGFSEEEQKEQQLELVRKNFTDLDLDTVTGKVTFSLKETEDGWKLVIGDREMNVLTGGLLGAVENLNDLGDAE